MKKRISKKDMERIRKLDLYSYLVNYEPNELVKDGRKDFRLRSNRSIVISIKKGMWFEKSPKEGVKGGESALDYFVKIEKRDFLEEAHRILDLINEKEPIIQTVKVSHSNGFILPKRNCDNQKLIRYLVGKRKLDKGIVEYCIQNNLVYEDEKHNVVFIGYDNDDKPKYGFKRSTYSDGKFDVEGSRKEFCFKVGNPNSTNVHVFEAAIDALSYISLKKNKGVDWKTDLYIALGGVGLDIPPALEMTLMWSNIDTVYLHLDNDEAGKSSTASIKKALSEKYKVIDEHPKYCKDFNEVLVRMKRKTYQR